MEDKFGRARAIALLCWPFFGPLIMRLVVRWTDHPEMQTMAVDRYGRLYVSPTYVAQASVLELALIIAGHECQHVYLGYFDRMIAYRHKYIEINGKPIDIPNAAHDIAIGSNLDAFVTSANLTRKLLNKGQLKFPEIAQMVTPEYHLRPARFKDKHDRVFPEGQIAEVYAKLLEDTAQHNGPGTCQRCGSGAGGDRMPWEDPAPADPEDASTGVDPQTMELLRRQASENIQEQAKKAPGTVPGNLSLAADAMISPPKVNWRDVLRRKQRAAINRVMGKADYTYAKPNRRMLAGGGKVVFPGTFSPEPRLLVRLDCSGSMSREDYNVAFSEVYGIFRSLGFQKVPVQAVDAQGYEIQYVSDIRQIKMTGGGGTDMMAGLEWAAKKAKAKFVIILTDGFTTWGPRPPGLDVLVVLTRKPTKSYPLPEWADFVVAVD